MDENTKTVLLTALAFAAPIASAAIYYFFHVRGAVLPGIASPTLPGTTTTPTPITYVDLTLEAAKVPVVPSSTKVP